MKRNKYVSSMMAISIIMVTSCSSPIITQTGNNGDNVSNTITGSEGSTITTTSNEATSNGGGSTPCIPLPGVNVTNSPLGDLTTTPQPCPPGSGSSGGPTPTPSPTPFPTATPTPSPTPLPGPTLGNTTPASVNAGDEITIIGTGFTGATEVIFTAADGSTVTATSFTVVSDSEIRVTAPADITDTSTVVVTTPNGSTNDPAPSPSPGPTPIPGPTPTPTSTPIPTPTPITNPPTITSFDPINGNVGESITITGTNFTGASSVKFGNFDASNFTVESDTEISVVIPSSATTSAISVTTPNGTATSSTDFIKNAITSSVIAGDGTNAISEGPGTLSSIGSPETITNDGITRLFVGSLTKPAIQLIQIIPGLPDTLVSTFAGNGTAGYNDAQGTAARFNGIEGLVTDSQGNLFVADTHNHRIRKVTPSGVVTTFAGDGSVGGTNGNASSASFSSMTGLAIDSQDNLYLTEIVGSLTRHWIRKITPSGDVSTYAGWLPGAVNGQLSGATFNSPRGIVVDKDDNIYVADYSNHQIRKITPDGIVSTLAGNSTAGFVNSTGVFAQFNLPWDLTVDSEGNVYVSDYGNNAVRKITPDGVVTTIMENISTPRGITVDPNGVIYVTSYSTNKVHRILQ